MLPRLLRAANSRPRYMQHDQNEAGQCERPPWSPSWTSSPKRRCLGMHDGHCRRRPTVQGEQAEPTQHALQFHYARPCRSLQPGGRLESLHELCTVRHKCRAFHELAKGCHASPSKSPCINAITTAVQRRHHPTSLGLYRPSQRVALADHSQADGTLRHRSPIQRAVSALAWASMASFHS